MRFFALELIQSHKFAFVKLKSVVVPDSVFTGSWKEPLWISDYNKVLHDSSMGGAVTVRLYNSRSDIKHKV